MENVIAKGSREQKPFNFKLPIIIGAAIGVFLVLISFISNLSDASEAVKKHTHTKYCYEYQYRSEFYEDLENDDLKASKMDCSYAGGAFGLACERTSLLPAILAVGIGLAVAFVKRSKAKGYTLSVCADSIFVEYSNEKTLNIPICSVFTAEAVGNDTVRIVTSEDIHTFSGMSDRDAVLNAIVELLPKKKIEAPVNSEQILIKAYPPAIKPVLLVLFILVLFFSLVGAMASEMIEIFLIGLVPAGLLFLFYMLAKTPYLTVTDKRVFYVSDFGHKLSLPRNKITVVVTHRFFNQLHLAAPTGRIHLFWVRNAAQVYDVVCALLNENQD